jgi:hypothetical protein
MMADVALVPPTRRACLKCGRQDEWDAKRGEWRICEIDGERQAGEPYCLHEWDITGNHRPIST